MTFYIGPEVNHTSAFSKKTLFVEEFEEAESIVSTAREYKATHISLAANNTFSLEYDWNTLLTELLDLGFVVTLPYPVELHNSLILDLSRGVLQSRNFVPLPSVYIMDMSTINPNLTLKIDDMSKEGTWTLHFHQLMDSNRFSPQTETQMYEIPATPVSGRRIAVPDTHPKIATPVRPGGNKIEDVATSPNVSGFSVPEIMGKTAEEVKSLNKQDIGLDPDAPSQLKPEESFAEVNRPTVNLEAMKKALESPEGAAEAYAEGSKSDPLSPEASKKPVKKK